MEKSMLKRLDVMKSRYNEIEIELEKEEIASDLAKFRTLSKEKADLEEGVRLYNEYLSNEQKLKEAIEVIALDDPELSALAHEEKKECEAKLLELEDQLKIELLPKDPNDSKNIIVEIRGAVGGDEANIFAGDLFRMYGKYAEKQGWKVKVLDWNEGAMGGYTFVSFLVKGENVYSKLKFESGAHRVQRVPKTEAMGRIHTSTATVLVMPEAEEVEVSINPADLKIDTYRSQGAGGQNVNKTESAVRVTHVPTGIVVSCQTEKAQLQNKEICMQMLRSKLYAYYQEKQDAERAQERKLKVGTGERSEKIRTYNYPQNRVTDHRIGFTIQKLDRVMEGDIEEIIEALIHFDQESKLLEHA